MAIYKQLTDTGYMLAKGTKNLAKKAIWRLRGGEYTDRMNARAKRFDELKKKKL